MEVTALRKSLISALDSNDKPTFKKIYNQIKKESADPFSLNGKQGNLLHKTLNANNPKPAVARFLIKQCPSAAQMLATYPNYPDEIPESQKSCLHLLAENGDNNLTVFFVKKLKFPDEARKNEYLNAKVWWTDDRIGGRLRYVSCLHIAAVLNNFDVLTTFLAAGANVDLRDGVGNKPNGETPLILAVQMNNTEAANKLLTKSEKYRVADVTKESHANSFTAIHWAVKMERVKMINKLISDGKIDFNNATKNCDRLEETLIELATKVGNEEMIKLLLDNHITRGLDKAMCTAIERKQEAVIRLFIGRVADFEKAWHYACSSENEMGIKIMLEEQDENKKSVLLNDKYLSRQSWKVVMQISDKLIRDNKLIEHVFDNNIAFFLKNAVSYNRYQALEDYFKKSDTTRNQIDTICREKNKQTTLHMAARLGELDCVRVLIRRGASMNLRDVDGFTPLHYAVKIQSIETSFELVKCMCPSDSKLRFLQFKTKDEQKTALHISARRGMLEVTNLLLERGARRDIRDSDGGTPLHDALEISDKDQMPIVLQIVELLLSEVYGKSDSYVNLPNNEGVTALHLAAGNGLVAVVDFLVTRGAVRNARTKEGYTPLHFAVGIGEEDDVVTELVRKLCDGDGENGENVLINCPGAEGETALHLAAGNGLIATTKQLLITGAEITTKDNEGLTALHHAVQMCTQQNLKEDKKTSALQIIDELCASGDEQFANIKCKRGNTALNLAAESGSFRTVKRLLGCRQKVRLDIQDEDDNTPLHDVISCKTKEEKSLAKVVEVLCKSGNDTFINRTNHLGETALHMAASKSYNQVVDKLLQQNVNLDNLDCDGWTALHSAVRGHSAHAVSKIAKRIMVDNKKLLNLKDKHGQTALHLAVQSEDDESSENLKVIESLCDIKADCDDMNQNVSAIDPECEDKDGRTPLHYAAVNRNSKVLEIVLEKLYVESSPWNIDYENAYGETALLRCVMKGLTKQMVLLLKHGADLHHMLKGKSTVLHRMVSKSLESPDAMIDVFRQILTTYHPKQSAQHLFKHQSNKLRVKIKKLTSELRDPKGMNVLQFAAFRGAGQFLNEILGTHGVYKNVSEDKFDVTYLIPEAMPLSESGHQV